MAAPLKQAFRQCDFQLSDWKTLYVCGEQRHKWCNIPTLNRMCEVCVKKIQINLYADVRNVLWYISGTVQMK